MQVGAVLIDELALDDGGDVVVSRPALYAFDEFQLVTARRSGAVGQLGPIGILEGGTGVSVTTFPERTLANRARDVSAFYFEEPWTAPPWTLYVLLPPPGFFAKTLVVHDERGDSAGNISRGSFENRLFYYVLLGGASDQHAFHVEAQFESDAREVERALQRIERGPEQRRWDAIRDSVAGPFKTSGALIATAAAFRSLFGL